MPRYSYTDFTGDSDDMNVPGSSDVTKPSEGWKGRDANDALRATNSALRNLGDLAAKLPANPDGSPNNGPNQGRIGTAAFQDAGTAEITGGVLGPNVRGSAGRATLLMIVCNFSDLNPVYAEQRTRGFDLCDGRTTTNPYPPFNTIQMPNFMGHYPWFADFLNNVNTYQFSIPVPAGPNSSQTQAAIAGAATRNVAVGTHNHGTTGGFTLGYDNLPPVVTAVATVPGGGGIAQGNDRILQVTTQGGGGSHGHVVGEGGAHSFSFNVRPPAIAVLPFLRVW